MINAGDSTYVHQDRWKQSNTTRFDFFTVSLHVIAVHHRHFNPCMSKQNSPTAWLVGWTYSFSCSKQRVTRTPCAPPTHSRRCAISGRFLRMSKSSSRKVGVLFSSYRSAGRREERNVCTMSADDPVQCRSFRPIVQCCIMKMLNF